MKDLVSINNEKVQQSQRDQNFQDLRVPELQLQRTWRGCALPQNSTPQGRPSLPQRPGARGEVSSASLDSTSLSSSATRPSSTPMQAPPSTTESTPSSRRQDPSLPLLHAPPSTAPIQETSLASSMPTPPPLLFPPRRKRPSPPLREAATPPAPSSSSALSPKTPLQLVSPLTAVTEGKPTTSP